MKLVKSKFEILDPIGYTIDDIYKSIELAGRTCYLSYDKITDDSAKKFVDMLGTRHHYSVYEQGTIYLTITYPRKTWNTKVVDKYYINPYSTVNGRSDDFDLYYYITTNYRVLVEQGWLDDLKYICEPTEYHEKRISVKWLCSRSIANEFVRHKWVCVI